MKPNQFEIVDFVVSVNLPLLGVGDNTYAADNQADENQLKFS